MLGQLARSKTFIIGSIVVAFWVFWGIVGARLTPDDPLEQSDVVLAPPSSAHWFGTDQLGRDVFSRVLAGASDTLSIAPLATLLGIVAGTMPRPDHRLLGRELGRRRDQPRHRRRAGAAADRDRRPRAHRRSAARTATLIIVIGFVFTPIVARTVRATVLGERDLDYVQAARLRGERAPYIMGKEILPNVMGPIVVETTVRLGYAIFAVAGLTFLGFGVQPPVAGLVAADRRQLPAAQLRHVLVDGALPGARDRHPRSSAST